MSAALAHLSLAEGTWKNKDSHFRSWTNFCEQYGFSAFPASNEALVLYVTYLAMIKSRAVGTIRNHLSSIKTYHAQFEVFVPSPKENLKLKMVLRGAQKFLKRRILQKLPITPQILLALLQKVPVSHPLHVLYIVLFLSFLRPSSIMPNTPSEFDPKKHLTWGDIDWLPDGVILNIKFSKTLQCLERNLRIPLSSSPQKPHLDPAKALVSLLANPGYPSRPVDPIFSTKDYAGNWIPMARSNSYPHFKTHIQSIGLDKTKFGFASFRRGALSHGILSCGNIDLLKLQGDWRSSCYNVYISLPAEARFSVSRAMINAV